MQNWRTLELLLEGGVPSVGLEMSAPSPHRPPRRRPPVGRAGGRGFGPVAVVLLRGVRRADGVVVGIFRARRVDRLAPKLRDSDSASRRRDGKDAAGQPQDRRRRLLRLFPVGLARESTIVVWAGMRGAVRWPPPRRCPSTSTSRSLLVLIAFLVAVGSLIVQGLTLGPLVRWLGVQPDDGEADAERADLRRRLRAVVVDDLKARLRHPSRSATGGSVTPFCARRTPKGAFACWDARSSLCFTPGDDRRPARRTARAAR